MVVIFLPCAERKGVRQDRTGRPSRSTVQAPHWPSPHPYFVPVRSSSSRKTYNSGRSASPSTECRIPLISSSITYIVDPIGLDGIGRLRAPYHNDARSKYE